jgi:hypothetical protein
MSPEARAQLRTVLDDVRQLLNDAKQEELRDPAEALHSVALAVGHLVMVIEELLENGP